MYGHVPDSTDDNSETTETPRTFSERTDKGKGVNPHSGALLDTKKE